MKRRDFFTVVAAAAVLRPFAAHAQPRGRPARIGVVVEDPHNPAGSYDALIAGLRELGLVEGQNLLASIVDMKQPRPELLAAVGDMARSGVEVLVALGPDLSLQAALSSGGNVPIVFVAVNYDPIAGGYAKSLARPGGRATGIFIRQPELAEKQVELLSEAFPQGRRLGILWDALSAEQFAAAERRAVSLGLEPVALKLDDPLYNFEAAFAALAARQPQILLVLSSPRFTASRRRIAELALQHRLASMFILKTYVEAGGLMSYGYEVATASRRAAALVKKILDGANPADLPIEQPTTYQLILNLATAKTLGLTLPQSLVARADEVIE